MVLFGVVIRKCETVTTIICKEHGDGIVEITCEFVVRTGDKQEWSYLVFLLHVFDTNIFCIFLSILLLIWVENSEYFVTEISI